MNIPALVSTEWLLDHHKDKNITILDCSMDSTILYPGTWKSGPEEFAEAHIPGARYFDIDKTSDPSSGLPHTLPKAESFQSVMRKLGVNTDDHIIVYDNCLLRSAARGWWMFRAMGHSRVSILDGGFGAWHKAGGPIESGLQTPQPGNFVADFQPNLFHSKQDMIEILSSRERQIVDARGTPRFRAEVPEPRPGLASGHIPGARNVPYSGLYDDNGKLKPEADLRQAFISGGVDIDEAIVTTCGSGVTACNLAFALYLLGKEDVPVFDGSWVEWGSAGDVPIETGPA